MAKKSILSPEQNFLVLAAIALETETVKLGKLLGLANKNSRAIRKYAIRALRRLDDPRASEVLSVRDRMQENDRKAQIRHLKSEIAAYRKKKTRYDCRSSQFKFYNSKIQDALKLIAKVVKSAKAVKS